ncbi:DUF805 domain-containing protein [Novosphingobium sp. M1R2S20]|uniref:DUF805 domain-containing protein n=1 Tax=Novosphingobium rhizovicinum TaxID=3228928 RepID=A0ABV3RDH2_9SPHN
MLKAIKHNLTHLFSFTGRDSRTTFWLYVLFLALVHTAISLLVSVPITGNMMGDILVAAQRGASEAEIQERVFQRVNEVMRVSLWVSVALSLALVAFLLAAFTRRLHDSGRSAWIAVVAGAIQVVATVMTIATMDDAIRVIVLAQTGDLEAVEAMRGRFVLQGLLGWVPMVLVFVFGVWPSTPGENRYGAPPTID